MENAEEVDEDGTVGVEEVLCHAPTCREEAL